MNSSNESSFSQRLRFWIDEILRRVRCLTKFCNASDFELKHQSQNFIPKQKRTQIFLKNVGKPDWWTIDGVLTRSRCERIFYTQIINSMQTIVRIDAFRLYFCSLCKPTPTDLYTGWENYTATKKVKAPLKARFFHFFQRL